MDRASSRNAPDGRDVGISAKPHNFPQRAAHHFGVGFHAGPILKGDDCLIDNHAHAVQYHAAAIARCANEERVGRVDDHISDDKVGS